MNGGAAEKMMVTEITNFGYTIEGKNEYEELMDCINSNTIRSGIFIHWKEYDILTLTNKLEKKEIDIIFPMTYDINRDRIGIRSVPLVRSHDVLIYDSSVDSYLNQSLRAGARAGSSQYKYLSELKYKDVFLSRDYPQLIDQLNEKRFQLLQ